jgi:hypothetical protein
MIFTFGSRRFSLGNVFRSIRVRDIKFYTIRIDEVERLIRATQLEHMR